MKNWLVRFLGDPEYGRERWEDVDSYNDTQVVATDASSAARRALAQWRAQDPDWRSEGFYGEGTIIGVQEVVEPPPVKVFVQTAGRPKLERVPAPAGSQGRA